jgi:hypothetical protein
MDQTKQVFVDESGRRGRLLGALMRVACGLIAAYLCVLVAGFLGASWVPSVHLPVVGDIFDVGSDQPLYAEAGAQTDAVARSARRVAHAAAVSHSTDDEAEPARDHTTGRPAAAPNVLPGRSRSKSRPRPAASAAPSPRATPNHGSSSGNPNAGPKPKPTPSPKASPNRGASGKSENAGPKPRPTKAPTHPSSSSSNQKPEATPSPGT